MKRAAIELNTVQSNVTARIKALETDIGCALFAIYAVTMAFDTAAVITAWPHSWTHVVNSLKG